MVALGTAGQGEDVVGSGGDCGQKLAAGALLVTDGTRLVARMVQLGDEVRLAHEALRAHHRHQTGQVRAVEGAHARGSGGAGLRRTYALVVARLLAFGSGTV